MSEQSPQPGALQVPPGTDPTLHEALENFDLADEEQILDEMGGRVTENFVYSFKQGGKEVTGLSFSGTNWACREYAKQGEVIRVIGMPQITIDPTDSEYIVVWTKAQRFVVDREAGKETALDSTVGVKRQWKKMTKKKYDGYGVAISEETVSDPNFIEKCTSKAIRNAKQALLPTDVVKKLISKALEQKQAKMVAKAQPPKKAAPAAQAPVQAPKPPPQASAVPPKAPEAPVAVHTPQVPLPVIENPTFSAPPAPSAPQPPPPVVPPAPAAPKMDRNVLVQKLDAVCKAAFGTQDGAAARLKLAALTGKSHADMADEEIKSVGTLLQGVSKKLHKLDGNKIYRASDGAVLFTGPAPKPAPEPLVVPDTDEVMF